MAEVPRVVYIGVDPGIRNMAVAVINDRKELLYTRVHDLGSPEYPGWVLAKKAANMVRDLIAGYPGMQVMLAIEDQSSMIHKLPKLYGVYCAVLGACSGMNVHSESVRAMELKHGLGVKNTGTHEGNKQAVVERLAELEPDWNLTDHNAADAALLALWARANLTL